MSNDMYINGFYMIEDDLENISKDGGVVEDSQGENAPIEKEVKVSEEKEVVTDKSSNQDQNKSMSKSKESIDLSNNEVQTDKASDSDIEEDSLNEESVKDSKSIVDFNFPNLIGKKIGMTQLFSNDGTVFPATVVEAGPCTVTQIKNFNNDGYSSVQIGYLDKKESKTTKALLGHFSKSKSNPKKILKEFKVNDKIDNLSLGCTIQVNQFSQGDFVNITGFSKGKGFAGHMKRHGFGGGRASHGKNSVMRKSGSVGAGTSPGRIFPGMKMAGRMGNNRVSIKNLQILNIDEKNNLIFVKGSIPGPNNRIVFLTKS